ncbi:MAG: TMEM165/GDT1 family protein [Elusimicrobia bacterium]|nr:TMEM165/GDT1 family protein [Elusimicrobiota bacterium]
MNGLDWKLFWVTFGSIFLAELGDKTQLGVLSFTASSGSPWTVFLAASTALIAATCVGVLAGSFLSKFIQPRILEICGGALFVSIGLWLILHKN